jgi:hypothetical protein
MNREKSGTDRNKTTARKKGDSSKNKKSARKPAPAAPAWFEPWHRNYEGQDPWFVVRFAKKPTSLQAKGIRERFALSPISNHGSAELKDRDLVLDFTDTGLAEDYTGGYKAFFTKFEQWIDKLHLFCPVFMVFFQPDDKQLAMDDDRLLRLHQTPQEAVARLAEGNLTARLTAAERLGTLIVKSPELAEELLKDRSEKVSDAARRAVAQFFFWGLYRKKFPDQIVKAFHLLRSPVIAAAADPGLVKLLNRECAQEEDRCVSALVKSAADPETGAGLDKLLSSWRTDKRWWYEKGIGGPAIAALMFWRQQENWEEVEQLAQEALADCTEPGQDDIREIEWTKSLLKRARKALGKSASEK